MASGVRPFHYGDFTPSRRQPLLYYYISQDVKLLLRVAIVVYASGIRSLKLHSVGDFQIWTVTAWEYVHLGAWGQGAQKKSLGIFSSTISTPILIL